MKKLVLMALLMVTLTNLHANEDWEAIDMNLVWLKEARV